MKNKLSLDFGLYSIDLKKVIRFLKQDLKDDWFQDPLLFKDRLDEKIIIDYFEKNISLNNGVYKPSKRIVLNVPKKKGTLRYSLNTNFFDRVAYHAFGIALIEYFDPLISFRVFNHRFNKKDFFSNNPRYLFHNSIKQWKKFEEFVRVDSETSTILITDIQNYFENIEISKLKNTLFNLLSQIKASGVIKSKIRFCIESLCNCLYSWSFDGKKGLPQNRDISSFIANLYLYPIDEFMIKKGYDYYRYMDDIRIICDDKFYARLALKDLSLVLRDYNLTLNSSKTDILIPKSKHHKDFIEFDSLKLERIDSLFNTKKKPIVALAFNEIKNELEKCIKQKDFFSKDFRFYVNRISKIALCNDIVKPENYFTKIKKNILKAIEDFPAGMDYYYNLLISVELTKNEKKKIKKYLLNKQKSVFSWQNYMLWKILIHQDFKDKNLISSAKNIIINNNEKTADKAGALLYLGKFGSTKDKKILIRIFSNDDNFLIQRHFLIALQDMEYNIVKSIKNKIVLENIGVYRKLKEFKSYVYLIPPEEVKYSDLINEVGFYA